MSLIPVSIDGVQLGTAATTHYPSSGVALVRSRVDAFALTNTTALTVTATVHIVPSGGTATASNQVLSAKSILPGITYIPPGIIGQWVEIGGTIQALASSAASISLVASIMQFTP